MITKYLFFTGGVVSSVGKGVTAAALGLLLKERGFKVAVQKLDPYINVDPGTMSPYQHGEVYVLDDGAETDLDLRLPSPWSASYNKENNCGLHFRGQSKSCRDIEVAKGLARPGPDQGPE